MLETEFSNFLESIGLSETKFDISFSNIGEIELSGLDENQKKQVESYLLEHKDNFRNVYLQNAKAIAGMTDEEYRIAGYNEMCNRFLTRVSNGEISVDDLSIEQKTIGYYTSKDWIVGLPLEIEEAVNQADSTSLYFEYKEMMQSILAYKQTHGNIPQYRVYFQWDKTLTFGMN